MTDLLRTGTRLVAVLGCVAALAGCGAAGTARGTAATPVVRIGVDPTVVGPPLRPSRLGLSIEALNLDRRADPALGGGDYPRYLRALGPGVLRIGGGSVERTFWTATGEPRPAWASYVATPASLRRVALLARRSGWRIVLGVALVHDTPARAADDVRHARAALGRSLLAVEIGNEPDPLGPAAFWSTFQSYVDAIHAAAPGVGIDGPTASRAAGPFTAAFVRRERGLHQLAALNGHYYYASACGDRRPRLTDLLSAKADLDAARTAARLASWGRTLGVPAVLSETNSVACSGTDGVSNAYGSALWLVDYALTADRAGVAGEDFHGTPGRCRRHGRGLSYTAMYYTPLCAATAGAAAVGDVRPQPEYVGLLALHDAGTGRFVRVADSGWPTVRAFALRRGDRLRLVLVDVGPTTRVTVDIGQSYRDVGRTVLADRSRITLRSAPPGSDRSLILPGRSVTILTLRSKRGDPR